MVDRDCEGLWLRVRSVSAASKQRTSTQLEWWRSQEVAARCEGSVVGAYLDTGLARGRAVSMGL
jgi:hypothetical protein